MRDECAEEEPKLVQEIAIVRMTHNARRAIMFSWETSAERCPTDTEDWPVERSRGDQGGDRMKLAGIKCCCVLALLIGGFFSGEASSDVIPPVTPPTDAFFDLVGEEDREVARQFYGKQIDVLGMPVVASDEVADLALQRTYEIVTHMLAGRPDLLQAMVRNRMYLVVIGKDQLYTDMPEYRNRPNPDYLNERVRGTGGRPTSFGEENLLSLPRDRYDDESIAVHEFCHTIDGTLHSIDPTWRQRLQRTFANAKAKGLFHNTYAQSNAGEYWAEMAQAYFDSNRINNWNHGPIGTREQLKVYDPEGYELVRSVFRLPPECDWRYSYLQPLPTVATATGGTGVRSVLHEVHMGPRVSGAGSIGQ